MLHYYGIEGGERYRTWRSVTPLALTETAARRRIDPNRQRAEAKSGDERALEEMNACGAVLAALRHAGLVAPVEFVRVRREPFSRNGLGAKSFAERTRFAKERLWHAEVRFGTPQDGPLVLGDGRYLGLGLMAPHIAAQPAAFVFGIERGLAEVSNPEQLAQALRRAVMARVQQQIGSSRSLPAMVSGHSRDGAPLRDGHHRHLAFVADLKRSRLLLVPPHQLSHQPLFRGERDIIAMLDEALIDFTQLAAGAFGLLALQQLPLDVLSDRLFADARVWRSVADYRPTRHAKRQSAAATLSAMSPLR